MNTAPQKETDPFPISPEQMKWPFRTPEEQKKIIAWVNRQRKRDKVNRRDALGPAPF